MTNPIFIHKEAPLAGSYLLGDYSWTEAMRLDSAVLICEPPVAGSVTFTLEIAGALTDKSFTVGPSGLTEVRQSLTLGIRLSANQSVRWIVTENTSAIEDMVDHVAITLSAVREVDAVTTDAPMTVVWRNGKERFTLFSYNPATHDFTDLNPALSASRAAIVSTYPNLSILIQSVEVLRVASQVLFTNRINAGGVGSQTQPQLLFFVGNIPVAIVCISGVLDVPRATHATPVEQINQFRLGDGAAFNLNGVTAQRFEQPL